MIKKLHPDTCTDMCTSASVQRNRGKINELVDAVNILKEESKSSLEFHHETWELLAKIEEELEEHAGKLGEDWRGIKTLENKVEKVEKEFKRRLDSLEIEQKDKLVKNLSEKLRGLRLICRPEAYAFTMRHLIDRVEDFLKAYDDFLKAYDECTEMNHYAR